MNSIVTAFPAAILGLGLLVPPSMAQSSPLPSKASSAKPTVAFLGLTRQSDPQFSESVSGRIRWELSADTNLSCVSAQQVSLLFAKGVLLDPEAGPMDMPKLFRALGAQYYAFGKLEPIAMQSRRGMLTPWSVKVKWTQGLHLRILNGSDGGLVYDGLVTAEVPAKTLFRAPDGQLGNMDPLEREAFQRAMAMAVAVESARTLARLLKEKTAVAAVGAEAKPKGG